MSILCGGYLDKPVGRGEYMDAELLPEGITSISDCIGIGLREDDLDEN